MPVTSLNHSTPGLLDSARGEGRRCNLPWRFDTVDAYQDLYDLPCLSNEQPWVGGEPIGDLPPFLVLILHKNGNAFIRRHPFGLELPWTSFSKREPVLCLLDQLARTCVPGITLGEITPIARIENRFFVGHELLIIQHGLAFLAQSLESIDPRDSGFCLPIAGVRKSPRLPKLHRELLSLAAERLNKVYAGAPEEEMEAAENHRLQLWLHHTIVRRFLAPFSSARLQEKVLECFSGSESFLDVSCGDDQLILKVAERTSLCVGNDVSLSLLRSLAARNRHPHVLFTVHNALELPFKRRFDFTLCKNTLHHLRGGEVRRLFEVLHRVSTRILFVDIVNLSSSRRAWLWNLYYRRFLGDQGGAFLTQDQFHQIISAGFSDREITFDHVDTIKGRYAFALVSPASA